jgi:ribosomal protein S18 acetylase RimI-like enzyme
VEAPRVERLGPDHAAEYRALMLEAYGAHPDAFTSTVAERAAQPLSWWEARCDVRADSREMVLAVLHEGRVGGVAGLSFESREKARHKATLFGMYVPVLARNRGWGEALVRGALAQARARSGIRVVQLTVTEGNRAARALYERCGFAAFGIEPLAIAVGSNYYGKVHMACDLAASG